MVQEYKLFFNILQIFVQFLVLQDTIPGANERDGKMDKIADQIELKF